MPRSRADVGVFRQSLVLAVCCAVSAAFAQGEAPATRTKLLNQLSLRSAQVALEHVREVYERTKNEYESTRDLYQRQIASKKELDDAFSSHARAQQQLEQAMIQLDKTKLGFLDNATHITIVEAKKYRDPEGRRMLDVVLRNTSNMTLAETAVPQEADMKLGSAKWQTEGDIRTLLDIENIMVSVVDGGSSVGKPYEQIVPLLPYDEETKLTFVLLADIDKAGIRLQYLNKENIETIRLENDSLQKTPTVVASQFSVEGELGSNVQYALNLEMLVTSDQVFSLTVTNLPDQITTFFSEHGSRVSSIRFSETVSKHDLDLQVSIPHNFTESLIDERIEFQAWVVTPSQLEQLNGCRRECGQDRITAEKLESIDAAHANLVLTPRGKGRLEILIQNAYLETNTKESVGLKADLHNDGNLTLFNIVPELSAPLRWDALIEPKQIERLRPNEKTSVTIHLEPNLDVGVGQYEAHLDAQGQTGSQVIEALKKRLTVRVHAKTSFTATAILVGGLLSLMVGIVFFGGRLSRR